MSYKKTIFALVLVTLCFLNSTGVNGSDVQAYPGAQFRVQQSFVDMVKDEFFYELPYIVNDVIAPLVPKNLRLFLGFFQVRNIKVYNFEIDTARAKFTIDPQQRGIGMNWATITNWNFHFECLYILFWPIEYSFNVDINIKDALLDNGLSLEADTHTGAPIVNFFNTHLDLAKSSVHFSGDFAIAIIGWFTNFLKTPIQVFVNEFFQPFVNLVINTFIIPDFLENGLIKMNTYYNNKVFDTLVIDATLPQNPIYYENTMDVFTDASIYFQKKGRHFQPPTTPMRFQLDEENLQFVISSFSINQLIQTITDTELLVVPVNHHLVRMATGFELTTTLLLAIIPELWYTYGHRNVSLSIQPLTGTILNWQNDPKVTHGHVTALANWYIHEDAYDTKTDLAFSSILDLEVDVYLNVNATKHVNITIDTLSLTGFNVTLDNTGGSVKNAEASILFKLQGVIALVEDAINSILESYPIKLPEFQVIDYSVKFDYQDGALGTGIMVTRK